MDAPRRLRQSTHGFRRCRRRAGRGRRVGRGKERVFPEAHSARPGTAQGADAEEVGFRRVKLRDQLLGGVGGQVLPNRTRPGQFAELDAETAFVAAVILPVQTGFQQGSMPRANPRGR